MLFVNFSTKKHLMVASLSLLFTLGVDAKENSINESAALESLKTFGSQIEAEYALDFLDSGGGYDLVECSSCRWSLHFVDRDLKTLEMARPAAMEIAYALLEQLYHQPAFQQFLAQGSLRYSSIPPQPQDNLVGFRIGFWDSNMERPKPPYLAQIRFCEGRLHYYYADPATGKLMEPIVETLPALN